MTSAILANIGSGNGLLPDGTDPLPESVFELSLKRSCGIDSTAVSKLWFCVMSLKIIILKLLSRLPVVNEPRIIEQQVWA